MEAEILKIQWKTIIFKAHFETAGVHYWIFIFIETLKKGELITDFDDAIFNFNLEKAAVHKDKSITFIFLSGIEIKVEAGE